MPRASRTRAARPSIVVASLVAALVLLGASAVQARDFCIDIPNVGGNPELIAMRFRVPRPGTCSPFAGLYWSDGQYVRSAAPGAACTPPDGSVMNFTFTVGFSPSLPSEPQQILGGVIFFTAKLAFPSLQGRLSESHHNPPATIESDAVGYACRYPF